MPILVAYASRYGATRDIAESIGRVLEGRGNAVDVRSAGEITRLEGYRAVVLGSALYSGGWLEDAREFLESFQEELAALPVWLFSSGPTTPGDPVEELGGWVYPEELRPLVASVRPLDIALFAGRIDPDALNLQDWLINRSMRGVSGDFRNWSRIESWATHIADRLEAGVAGSRDGSAETVGGES
ncbi:MAG: flavodoxin domain-containing protein [Deinococcales bacterium]